MVRIVKMEFRPEEVDTFLALFAEVREAIRSQPGCTYLALWRDRDVPHVLFTHSVWEREADLAAYRASDLFSRTWARTKVLFAGKPEAWSLDETDVVL